MPGLGLAYKPGQRQTHVHSFCWSTPTKCIAATRNPDRGDGWKVDAQVHNFSLEFACKFCFEWGGVHKDNPHVIRTPGRFVAHAGRTKPVDKCLLLPLVVIMTVDVSLCI